MDRIEAASVDIIFQGKSTGGVAKQLLANHMNPQSLRTNATLLYDEWKYIDTEILDEVTMRKNAVEMLQRRGLVHSIPNGLAKTVFAYQDASDMEAAELNMDGVARARNDRPEFDMNYLPMPIVHKDFSFSAREIEASRAGFAPLDTTAVRVASRKVMEKVEEILMVGASTYTFGGGTLRGLIDHGDRNTGSLTGNWDDSSVDGEDMLKDVLAMKQDAIDDYYFGPYGLILPTNFETAIDGDFKSNSDKSVRERLLGVRSVEEIIVSDQLTADNVVLAQLTGDVVRLVEGLPIMPVEWETDGGMRLNFKVMAILVPQVRSSQEARSGVIHYT